MVINKPCEHEVNGAKCGKPAMVVIKAKQGKVIYEQPGDGSMGRGTGSAWIPVCDTHRWEYPDYDGFVLDGAH